MARKLVDTVRCSLCGGEYATARPPRDSKSSASTTKRRHRPGGVEWMIAAGHNACATADSRAVCWTVCGEAVEVITPIDG